MLLIINNSSTLEESLVLYMMTLAAVHLYTNRWLVHDKSKIDGVCKDCQTASLCVGDRQGKGCCSSYLCGEQNVKSLH